MIASKHQKLMWQLLCMSGNTQKIEYHPWIGFKKKPTNTTAGAIKLFQEIYPNMKQKEIEMLATMHTKKECKDIAEEYNIQGTPNFENFICSRCPIIKILLAHQRY